MSKEKDRQPFISVRDLKKYFCLDNYKLAKAKTRYIHAVDDVSFDIYKGEIFGIIGESGSGKSTIGRCVLKLIDVDSGEIYFDGKNITHVSRKEQQELRSRMQMVFQNPLASFDPKKTIRFSLEESAKVHKIKPEVYKARIKQLMEYIALPEDLLTRYPKDLSGGQLQRLAIARALMLEPDFILADEPVSALDVSVQAQILNLMLDLKEDKGQTILFISHDLNFDMMRILNIFFNINRIIAKGCPCFGLRQTESSFHLFFRTYQTHTFSSTSRKCFQHNGIANFGSYLFGFGNTFHRIFRARYDR